MTYSRIAGTGGYLPEHVISNKDFESFVDTSDEWIRERTGIKTPEKTRALPASVTLSSP